MRKSKKYQKSTFALNVIEARKKLGMNGIRFAEFAGIPYSTLADIEAGMSGGRLSTKQKIASALGVTIDALNTPKTLAPASSLDRVSLIGKIVAALPALNEEELSSVLRMVTHTVAEDETPAMGAAKSRQSSNGF